MGLRYRKSINLGGGFRVNLSKNGIGYSWGVKGYRVTKTADGRTRQTVSIPGTGLSYVEEHKSGSTQQTSSPQQKQADSLAGYSDIQSVSSAGASEVTSAEYEDLFKNIMGYRVLVILLAVGTVFSLVAAPPVGVLVAIFTVIYYFKGNYKIEYSFDETEQKRWDDLSAAWRAVASSQALYEITMNAKAKNSRTTAGIESAIETEKMSAGGPLPWYIKTNISPVVFSFKTRKMAIMPDRLMIFDKEMGAIDYSEIHFDLSAVGYLESGKVPTDAELVKQVWAYANKDGSPDKRYSNNKQFPVMKYAKFIITSPKGLNIQFMCSNEAAADHLNDLLNK